MYWISKYEVHNGKNLILLLNLDESLEWKEEILLNLLLL